MPYSDGAVIDMRFPFAVTDLSVFVREDTVSLVSDTHALSGRQETTSGNIYHVYNQDAAARAG